MSRKQKKNLKMYSQTLYQVERVVQVRWKQHRQECLIKWKGYDDCYNTWQPKEHITLFYKQAPLEEKDDDPQYVQNIPLPPSTPHKYETRLRKDRKSQWQPISTNSRQDSCQQEEEYSTPDHGTSPFQFKRPANENSCDELQIRKKGQQGEPICAQKQIFVKRILSYGWDETVSKKIGIVETYDNKTIKMQQDVLKSRYPNKIIEYYEQQLRNRAGRYY